tara:strand:+ start:14993 stop:15808 length:816 start_codon:yes stop_codon:yes gene_type:complete
MKIIKFLIIIFITLIATYKNSLAETNGGIKHINIEDRYYLDDQINLTYVVRSLGLKIAKLDFEVNFLEAQYFSTAVIKTQGIGDLFSNSSWTFSARGTLKETHISPKFYNNHIETKRGVGHISIVYRGKYHNILARPEMKYLKELELYRNLNPNIIDPLSSILEMAIYPPNEICTGEWEVTDGRRIFLINYEFKPTVSKCGVKYTPLIGFSEKEMEKEEEDPSPYHLLELVRINLNNNISILIPRIIEANGGPSAIIELQTLRVNGEVMKF